MSGGGVSVVVGVRESRAQGEGRQQVCNRRTEEEPRVNTCEPEQWVLNWQVKLHEWAADDPHRRYHDLYNLVYDLRTLQVAWAHIRSNKGSRTAGVDGMTRYHVETRVGVDTFLLDLHRDLKDGCYRTQPVRQKGIPKKDGKTRYLGIPTLRDRVAQQALRMVLEPILEADFYEGSYAYRPGRRAQDAIEEIYLFTKPRSGYEWVIEGDIKACFDHVDHGILVNKLRERVTDKRVIGLVKLFLKSGVITELEEYRSTLTGTPQGGIVSPLLANLYLSILDEHFAKQWREMSRYPSRRQYLRSKGHATFRLVRFADDFVILVKGTQEQAERLKEETAQFIATDMRMELSQEKTLITHISKGFEFLGHRIQMHQRPNGKPVLYTYPSKDALMRVKRKVKEITSRATLGLDLKAMLGRLNPVIRGWANYFRFDVAKRTFAYLDYYVWRRVFRWLRKKHSKVPVKKLRRRLFPDWQFRDGAVELFRPSRVTVERYTFKGTKILHAWNEHLVHTDRKSFRRLTIDEERYLEQVSLYLHSDAPVESRMR